MREPGPDAGTEGRTPVTAGDVRTAVLVMVALGLTVFADCVFRGRMLFQRDLSIFFSGWMDAFAATVAQGSWPLWNPYPAFGQPMLATATAQILYPTTWLNLVLPFATYMTLFAVLHVVIGGLGGWALVRGLGGSQAAALVAGAAWASSAAVVSTVNMVNMYAAAAWLPWALHFARRSLALLSRRDAVLWGGCVTLMVLAGSPEIAAMSVAALPALLGDAGVRRTLRNRIAGAVVIAGAAAVLALLLSAVQWLPTLELQRGSNRASLTGDDRAFWSNHPFIVAQAVLPLSLDRLPLTYEARHLLFSGRDPFLYSIYMGGPLAGLALAGLWLGTSSHRRWWAVLGIGSLLLSFGTLTPVYGAASRLLPFLLLFRYPAKAVLLSSLALAVLAGFGVDAWSAPRRGGRVTWLLLVGLPLAALAVAAVALSRPAASLWPLIVGPPLGGGGYERLPELVRMSAHLTIAAFFTGAMVLATVARAILQRPAPALAALAGALGIAELAIQSRDVNLTVPRSLGSFRPALLEAVPPQPPNRTLVLRYAQEAPGSAMRLLGRPAAVVVPVDATPEVEFAAPRDYPLLAGTGIWGIEGFPLEVAALRSEEAMLASRILHATAGLPEHAGWLRLFGVQYVITLHREGPPLVPLASRPMPLIGATAYLWAVPGALPRAYWASRAAPGYADDLVRRALFDPAFDPSDEVLLQGTAGTATLPPPGTHTGSARVLVRRPDALEIETESTAEGHLVVTEGFAPGWRARVDGRGTPVLRANTVFRSVRVPAGRHRVSLRYRPLSVMAGAALSACGLLAAAVLWTRGSATRRRRT
jgi:hypothetical protein